ncbi:DUF11 domain-containing protein [Sphingomonas spermidinifaciens]|nr:DUF11 domain-containing protein [Sphingomonas spermidinifaciens]
MNRLSFVVAIALGCSPAAGRAACTAANTYRFTFASQPAATLAYGSAYNYSATTSGGASRSFNVAIAQNGLSSTTAGGVQMPAIGTLVTGPDATQRDLVLGGAFAGRTTSITSTTRTVSATFTFPQPIRDFSITVHDVDFSLNQFRDWVAITGNNGSSAYNPSIITPFGNGNGASQPRTATSSSVTVGTTTTPLALLVNQAAGSGTAGNNSDTGTITASFAEPVTSIAVRYGSYPLTTGETVTGQQAIGIGGISFCPMPSLTLAKTSAPAVQSTGAFNVPGNIVIYTITMTNNGGSPVDPGTVRVTDMLPAGVIFRNAPFDGTTSLPVKATGASLPITASSLSYTDDGGASWNYAPASGPDPNVKGVQIVAPGTLDAGEVASFSFAALVR